jgi:CubicO group peptidase (beta-lactamase class C family)
MTTQIKMMLQIFFFLVLIYSCNPSDDSNVLSIDDSSITETLYFPPINSSTWETTSLSELNWNENALSDLLSFLDATNTESFIILKDGKIVVEEYFQGTTSTTLNPWFSAGKTLTAFTVGLAQQDGYVSIEDQTSDYLGEGWTDMSLAKEDLITIRNQLTMTSGGDFTNLNWNCTDSNCLNYQYDAGAFWFYHNAFYTLLQSVLETAIPQGFESYFETELEDKIGIDGTWFQSGYNNFYFSTAKEMARFGLLNLNRGNWDGVQLLNESYFDEMTNTSQDLNKSYGYLWWLNGKDSYKTPGSVDLFSGKLIPNAPNDLIAGLGARDQKLYIVPSQSLVIIRMGNAADTTSLGPSSYDDLLWEKINAVID